MSVKSSKTDYDNTNIMKKFQKNIEQVILLMEVKTSMEIPTGYFSRVKIIEPSMILSWPEGRVLSKICWSFVLDFYR